MNLVDELEQRKEGGLLRKRQEISSAQGAVININDEEYINFSSNDYLGMANNAELKNRMIDAVLKYGIGAASSQLIVGHLTPHKLLEEKLSSFLNRDASLVFPTGYQANLAIASTLIDSNTVVFQDKLNHASLIDAAMLSRGKLVRYRHNDLDHLNSLFEKYKHGSLLVMTDGVFSMDGDYASLKEIVGLCKTYNALLVVDDAHGFGVLGRTGAGLLEELGLNQQQVPLLIGTFGKAFGASGAFISGSHLHIEAFIQKARTYIYTTALLPAIAATLIKTIDLVVQGDRLRENLNDLIGFYKAQINCSSINYGNSLSQIQPIILGDADKATNVSKSLFDNKLLVSAIRPPTVLKGTSRLRVSLTATHTREQVRRLAKSIKTSIVTNE